MSLEQICTLTRGASVNRFKSPGLEDGTTTVSVLKVANIGDCCLQLALETCIIKTEDLNRHQHQTIQPGQIIVPLRFDRHTFRAGLVEPQFCSANHPILANQNCCILQVREDVDLNPFVLAKLLNSEQIAAHLEAVKTVTEKQQSTSDRNWGGISINDLKQLRIPMLSRQEQTSLVNAWVQRSQRIEAAQAEIRQVKQDFTLTVEAFFRATEVEE